MYVLRKGKLNHSTGLYIVSKPRRMQGDPLLHTECRGMEWNVPWFKTPEHVLAYHPETRIFVRRKNSIHVLPPNPAPKKRHIQSILSIAMQPFMFAVNMPVK